MNQPLPLSPLPEPSRRDSLWRQRGRRALDAFTVYLPVVLMAVLALGSYWVLRATPGVSDAEPARAERREPDYFMTGFAVKVFEPDGRLRGEIAGREVRHRPDTGGYEADDARVRSVDARGALTTASARRMLSNEAQTEFTLDGDAVVVREAWGDQPRMEIRGERLHFATEPNRAWSDLPVQVLRDRDVVSADRFNHTAEPEVLEMQGRVRLLLQPR
jgi:lipopolysaccharide export system protein LptC